MAKVSMRTCIGCGARREKAAMVRVGLHGGTLAAEPSGKGGRGAYLCSADCAKSAHERRQFSRAFKQEVRPAEGFFEALASQTRPSGR